ncbi:MAG: hypothetical protein LBE13_21835, partial [Bacteroidales bacterium]|nr:hypothetical protein [Bacteroidales bacterium]
MNWFWIIFMIILAIIFDAWWIILIIGSIFVILVVVVLFHSNLKGNASHIPTPSSNSSKRNNVQFGTCETFISLKDIPYVNDIATHKSDSSKEQVFEDPSIVDITQHENPEKTCSPKEQTAEVPYWAHQYVYSYSEINYASHEQKLFYFYFKNRFLKGECLDLNGNTNYAFILLFDLLRDYNAHKDIAKLESHLKLLGQFYPKTKSYANRFLIEQMENAGDKESAGRIREEEYDYWKLGVKYRDKLNLTSNQVKLLNSIVYSANNFNQIDFCMNEIIKLYFSLLNELNSKYIQEGITFDAELESVAILIAKQKYHYPKDLNTKNKYLVDGVVCELHSSMFKYCENAIREFYGHKRMIIISTDYRVKTKALYETKILSKITKSLQDLVLKITPPDEATEIELNAQNKTRWKAKFEVLTNSYAGKPKEFVDEIIHLGELNKNNPSVELLFFEASKFISKHDNISALSLYIHYLYHDLKSSTFDNRKLTKTVQKCLFKNNEQLRDFEIIVSDFLQNGDMEKALRDVSNIYTPKRKKIQLDDDLVKKVRKQHSGTVDLLNEYLQDEYEDKNSTIKTREINNDEIEIEIIQKTTNIHISPYISTIPFQHSHISVLSLFAKNNLSISQSEI